MIAIISKDKHVCDRLGEDLLGDVHLAGEFKDTLEKNSKIQGYIIGADELPFQEEQFGAILDHPEASLKPVWTLSPSNTVISVLCEGLLPSSRNNIVKRCAEAAEYISLLPRVSETLDQDQRLLRFAFTHPNRPIAPKRSYSAPQLYTYPLLERFCEPGVSIPAWLESLEQRGLLAKAAFVDRIRLCTSCEKAHINYIDCCPNCKKYRIVQKNFLHCFTCGNVAMEEEYLHASLLQCPKCSIYLRHIGADYDRSLEKHKCLDCGFIFEEPEITAICYECGASNRADELTVRNIYEYKITEEGRLGIRIGSLNDVFSALDSCNFVHQNYFYAITDWSFDLWRRYKSPDFSLIGISFKNVKETIINLGRAKTTLLLEEIVKRLRQELRSTDIATRLGESRIAVLLPLTPPNGVKILIDRLLGNKNDINTVMVKKLHMQIKEYTVSECFSDSDTALAVIQTFFKNS
ncbi:MAG: diguanylate cyclase [bacterium]